MTTLVREPMSRDQTLAHMRAKLHRIVPEAEILLKAELAYEINRLKIEQNAVILGYNYMEPALYHSVPDYVGDSLDLSRRSAETDADIIVFCGVRFMAETAKILSPDKMVLIPSPKAGCSLAEGITAADVRNLRARYPQAVVVTYVNTYADVKAETDYCCTSSNATAVARHLYAEGYRQILFLPDEFLARNTAHEMGWRFIMAGEEPGAADDPVIIGWNARCEVHVRYTPEDVINARKQFPGVAVLAHPECSPEVIALADKVGSTRQLIRFVKEIDAPNYLLLTECSMGDNIMAENPEKEMVRMCSFRCPHMNEITLEDTLAALQHLQYQVEVDPAIIERARLPIDRMLAIG